MNNSTIDSLLVYASWLILPAAIIAVEMIIYEAFKDGQKAQRRGASVIDNPWPIGSVLGESWRMGWLSVDEKETK